jgi:hypothetical protein
MTDIAKIRDDVAEARERVAVLAAEAELASDRGGHGSSPREIAQAEMILAHHQRRLELAREAIGASSIPPNGE